jgi:hypothetical protein
MRRDTSSQKAISAIPILEFGPSDWTKEQNE